MTDLNSIVITGNLVHDIGEKDLQKVGETTKLTVTIASNQSVKVNGEWKNEPSFFDVVMWGKLADNLKPYLVKGKSIGIEGHLKQDRWEKDGQKKSRIYIIADNVKLLGGKADGAGATSENTKAETSDFPEDIEF